MAMIGAVALALASSGGGEKKKSTAASGVNTIKTTPGFSLKAGRSYSNSLATKSSANNFVQSNTVVTYRKGNTIYILPSGTGSKQQVNTKNNLNLLNLKLKLRK